MGKRRRGERQLVADELAKLHRHLLAPLGVAAVPSGLAEAAAGYLAARDRAEARFGVRTATRHLQEQVMARLRD